MRPLPAASLSTAGNKGILKHRKEGERSAPVLARSCRRSYRVLGQTGWLGISSPYCRDAHVAVPKQKHRRASGDCALLLKAEARSVGTKGYDLADLSHVGGPEDSWDHLKLAGMIRVQSSLRGMTLLSWAASTRWSFCVLLIFWPLSDSLGARPIPVFNFAFEGLGKLYPA